MILRRSLVSIRSQRALATLVVALALSCIGASPALAESRHWSVSSSAAPTNLPPGGEGRIIVTATNLGDSPISAQTVPIVITENLPKGFTLAAPPTGQLASTIGQTGEMTCTPKTLPSSEAITCTYTEFEGEASTGLVHPSDGLRMTIPVKVPAEPSGTRVKNVATASGGNAAPVTGEDSLTITSAPPTFGIEKYSLRPENEDGTVDTQAGSHPFQLTSILEFNHLPNEEPVANPRNLQFNLPPGLIGSADPKVVPQCNEVLFDTILPVDANLCLPETAIGVAQVTVDEPVAYHGRTISLTVPVFNLLPAPGEPARFGFEALKDLVVLDTAVRTGKDYGVVVTATNTSQAVAVLSTKVTFWGVPSDTRHNAARGWECVDGGVYLVAETCAQQQQKKKEHEEHEAAKGESPKAFLSLPTSCGTALSSPMKAQSWAPHAVYGETLESEFRDTLSGCELLPFSPSIGVETDEHAASTPTGMTVNIHVPQESTLAPGGLAEADIKATTVALPVGLQLSPAAASGLLACPAAAIGLEEGFAEESQTENDHFTAAEPGCADAAKVGTVAIKTPLLPNELKGAVFLASQNTNPFKVPLVLYIIAEDKKTGVLVKLAGTVVPDPVSGQLVSTFENTPQVPFEDFSLHFFNGPRASQSTPAQCGSYTTSASFTPWSGAPALAVNAVKPFEITSGPNGAPCPTGALPFAPSLQSASASTQGGAYTGSFTLAIGHADGDQALNGITVGLPAGFAAMISSVTPCPEPAVGTAWTCGAPSLIGHATTVSGLGGQPFSLEGAVYLTAGYDGAPFGLLVETHAKAGPFDLGMVDVRSRINVDPNTAAVTITTDGGPRGEIVPTILKGVPVQLKQILVTVDRPNFQFNPTNCTPATIASTLSGAEGGTAKPAAPFQTTGCASLPFGPKLTAEAGRQGSKTNGTSLNVTVESAGLGQANIQKVDLQLPAALPSRLSTIQKACLAAVFAANPATCPEGSNIGRAKITTPVLKNPLEGPAYLVSYGGAKFPDVEFVLQGEGILLILDGHTDIKKGITYSRFEAAPDAPFTKFVTELPAGPHSALTAFVPVAKNYSLCGTKLTMPTEITGQNGLLIKQATNIAVKGCTGPSVKKPTRAQRLKKALKACHKKKAKSKRVACEKQARKKYGPKTHKKK